MTKLSFKAVREIYMENGKSRKTVKTYETYEQAKAYAKRYSKLTGKATFVNVSVYINTDDYKYRNVDIYTIDSNLFENEHLEEIEKFNAENAVGETNETETAPEYLVKSMNGFEFKTSDLQEAKKVLYRNVKDDGDTEYAVIEVNPDNTWKQVLVSGRMNVPEQREKITSFIWAKPAYEVDEYVFSLETEAEAMEIAKKLANKRKKNIRVYKNGDVISTVEPDKQETTEEPTGKVVGFRVGLGGKIYKTEAEAFANNPKDAKQVFKVIDNGNGLTWEYQSVNKSPDEIIAEKPIPHIKTMQEWKNSRQDIETFCKVGDLVDEKIVDFFINVLPPATWRTDLVQCGEAYNHGGNPKTGRWEAMYTTFAKNNNGQWYYAGICFKNQREEINNNVMESPAEYATDSELISMLVKEPVNASLYDFMREPQKIKISRKGRKKLNAVREIVQRALVAVPEKRTSIGTVEQAARLMMKRLRYKTKEYFYVIILNTKNRVVNISKISEGSLNSSVVDVGNVYKEILKYETAARVIFCHNHPSGEVTPSDEDIKCTSRLMKAGKILNIDVLDHIVIGDGVYTSFKKEGIIK